MADYLDLTGLTRMRWRTRTENLHVLHPVVKLADGSYIVARHAIETGGDFLSVELAFNDMKELQGLLAKAGYDVGTIDGFAGLKTRQAVKAVQVKYGLAADSYPTAELLARMRGGR